ncbi:MAG: bifunctional phosphopantothenoylcysteine decarboxylase/phosphopantothenate--cysteine ligase CoaBC [Paludibacteraceae bacterium]|nr:bifunctional phosphopantothenoylcysteine decarboxylase/phosphopantothenate--cysteine ligase CoaBC [Paludibacteraceae bacterium]
MLEGKHILIGISGGIAAYKIPELIRLLVKAGADVRVTTTANALQFVTETTLRTLSGHTVYSDVFASVNAHATEHISLPSWADLMLVAPATANVLGKMANGIADDALTTTFAAMRKPVIIAPAMNDNMYNSPATQQCMRQLGTWDNVTMLDCAEGPLACGTSGKGRMQEPEYLLEQIYAAFTPKTLSGKKIVITAGPTIEKLDPVRYLSNFSTGKMGRAIAQECTRRGAQVTLIMGNMSAREMCDKAVAAFADADCAILAAAVADFRPESEAGCKIKKHDDSNQLTLQLVENPDIAATLGKIKKPAQQLIGFALETDHEIENARHKMGKKNLDMIVLNSLQDPGAGFGYDTNKVTLLFNDGTQKNYPLLSKEAVAGIILDNINLS